MSEEEKDIEYLKKYINWETYGERSLEKAIKTILDLYNKEKEKNRQSKMRIVQLENEIAARIEDINKDYISKYKTKEKIDDKFREAKGLYERGVQPQAQYTMKLLRDLEEQLLNKEE